MSKFRVFMLGWEYPPHNSGGLGIACQGIAHALVDNQIHVCFMLPRTVKLDEKKIQIMFADETKDIHLTTPFLDTLSRELQDPYLSYDEYERKLLIFIKNGGKIIPRSMVEQVNQYGFLIKNIVKGEINDFDVIHAHDWLCFPAGIVAKVATGKPLVVQVHATEFDRSGGQNINQEVYKIEREGMHKADHIIAVSGFTKNIIVNKYGIDESKVTVVHNGTTKQNKIKHSIFKDLYAIKKNGVNIVLFAGRITIQKGVDYFVHAAKKVLDYEKNVYFVIAGSGDMENQIKQLTHDLEISDKFIFTGHYTVDEQPDLFGVADVVVMPSISEPFGIIPLESMCYGTPVIISKQSGVSEVISHGLKVDFWDTDEMANKILAVLTHKPLKETLSAEGSRQANGITWNKTAKKIIDVYNKVLY